MSEDEEFRIGAGPFICARCIGEDDLQRFVRAHLVARTCSFCNRQHRLHPIAADADMLAEYMEECISQEYQDAVHEVAYESREGGYQASTRTTEELLFDLGVEPANEEALTYLVGRLPDNAWVEQDFYRLHPFDVLN